MLGDPVEDDDFILREILPEEVWDFILQEVAALEVESAEDLENVSNSSPFFHRLLDSKKVQFLFPKVLDILLTNEYSIQKQEEDNQFFEELANGDGHSSNNNETNMLELDKGGRKILKLRLVCKRWKNSIDHFYEEKLFNEGPDEVLYGETFEQTFTPYTLYNGKGTIFSFLKHFNESHGNRVENGDSNCNPFLSRGCQFIIIRAAFHVRNQEFLNNVSTLLRKYGHHLYKCTFDITEDNDIEPYHGIFRNWLLLLPNLKKLEIVARSFTYAPEGREEQDLTFSPFPRIATLESIALDGVISPLNTHLLRANNQLTHLYLNDYSYVNRETALTQMLPNLTHLKMIIYDPRDFEGLEASRFNPAFSSVELVFYFVPYRSRKLLRLLGRIWGASLTNLTLLMVRRRRNRKSEEKGKTFCRNCSRYRRMYLPHVTTFKVDVEFRHRRYSSAPNFFDATGFVA